jgi:hypothetical protein
MTLGVTAAAGVRLIVWCKECQHQVEPDPAEMATLYGLWTVRAFDRCLLLVLLYPVATLFVVWVHTGHVGPAERALHLAPNLTTRWVVDHR